MPRTAREKSETGIYHVMIRGMDQGQLFFEDGARAAFLDILVRYKKSKQFSMLDSKGLCALCGVVS